MNEYIEFKEEYPFIEWNDQFIKEYFIFCESDDNVTEDIEESAPGPYEQWLKLNDYDPKTNTIKHVGVINDKRVNVGKLGSNKERNRLNKFLKENDFDPKTGTYRSDIKLPNGQYARIPLNIGKSWKGNNIDAGGAHMNSVGLSGLMRRYEPNNTFMNKMLTDSIKHDQEKIDILREDDPIKNAKLIKYYKNKIKSNRNRLNEKPDHEYQSKEYQDAINKFMSINMPKRELMKKPAQSNSTLKHEEGHSNLDINHPTIDDNPKDTDYRTDVKYPGYDRHEASKAEQSPFRDDEGAMSVDANGNIVTNYSKLDDHDRNSEEHYADTYGVKHNRYAKNKDSALRSSRATLDNMQSFETRRTNRKVKKYKKDTDTLINNLENINSILSSHLSDNKLDSNDAIRIIDNITKNNKRIDDLKEWRDSKLPNIYKQIKVEDRAGKDKNRARSEVLASQIKDSDFKQSGDPSSAPKTNKERSQERKERGELPRKQKKQAKKQNVVKEYMI